MEPTSIVSRREQRNQWDGTVQDVASERMGFWPGFSRARTLIMKRSVRVIKRIMDIVFSLLGLLLTLPLYPLIALAIKLESHGPIFFAQERVNGIGEETEDGQFVLLTFRMVKFRTMVKDAEAVTGAVLASKGDARVTRVGGFLRRTRLDELPQFWNVLVGDMSLVGPRPERPELLQKFILAVPFFEERIRNIKPGITGLAQVNLSYSGGMDTKNPLYKMKDILTNPFELSGLEDSIADDMRIKMLFDFAYSAALESVWTFLVTDFKIILKTPLVMLFGRGR